MARADSGVTGLPGGAPVKENAAKDAIIPVDNNDSWVVGSDRMSNDSADTTKRIRAFFNKINGAFRTGYAESNQWDAPGPYSFSAGYNCTANGYRSGSFGDTSSASGHDSFATGYRGSASGAASFATGNDSKAQGAYSFAQGNSTIASGVASHSEGSTTRAVGSDSHAEGRGSSAGRQAQHAKGSGYFAVVGDAQMCNMVLLRQTTSATPDVLRSGNSAIVLTGESTNVLTVPVSCAYQLKISAVARRTDVQGEMAGFTWEGLVGRDSTGSARIIGTPIEAAWGDVAADPWSMVVSIDTVNATNNYVAVTVTGEAGKTIRWVAKMEWVEVAG